MLLRSHVIPGANECVRSTSLGGGLSGDSEVANFQSTLGIEKNIIRLEIPMHYFLTVHMLETKQHLQKPRHDFILREPATVDCPLLLNAMLKVAVAAELHDNHALIRPAESINHFHYVCMIQAVQGI